MIDQARDTVDEQRLTVSPAEFLCVGGPWDGRWVTLSSDCSKFSVRTAGEGQFWYVTSLFARDRDAVARVAHPGEMSPGELVEKILRGYRQCTHS